MSLRLQYSLRQALAIVLFGLPLPVLEQILARTISADQVEVMPSGLLFLIPCLMVLSGLCFVAAYQRFEEEFQPPLESTAMARHWGGGLLVLVGIGLVALGSTGWPINEYHWARFGIIGSGLYFGWLLAKWVYFDWLEASRFPDRPNDPPGSGVTALPNLPTGSAAGSSMAPYSS